mgnify:CR=1 FL=1
MSRTVVDDHEVARDIGPIEELFGMSQSRLMTDSLALHTGFGEENPFGALECEIARRMPSPVPPVGARVRRAFLMRTGRRQACKQYFYGQVIDHKFVSEIDVGVRTTLVVSLVVKFDDYDEDPRLYSFKPEEVELVDQPAASPYASLAAADAPDVQLPANRSLDMGGRSAKRNAREAMSEQLAEERRPNDRLVARTRVCADKTPRSTVRAHGAGWARALPAAALGARAAHGAGHAQLAAARPSAHASDARALSAPGAPIDLVSSTTSDAGSDAGAGAGAGAGPGARPVPTPAPLPVPPEMRGMAIRGRGRPALAGRGGVQRSIRASGKPAAALQPTAPDTPMAAAGPPPPTDERAPASGAAQLQPTAPVYGAPLTNGGGCGGSSSSDDPIRVRRLKRARPMEGQLTDGGAGGGLDDAQPAPALRGGGVELADDGGGGASGGGAGGNAGAGRDARLGHAEHDGGHAEHDGGHAEHDGGERADDTHIMLGADGMHTHQPRSPHAQREAHAPASAQLNTEPRSSTLPSPTPPSSVATVDETTCDAADGATGASALPLGAGALHARASPRLAHGSPQPLLAPAAPASTVAASTVAASTVAASTVAASTVAASSVAASMAAASMAAASMAAASMAGRPTGTDAAARGSFELHAVRSGLTPTGEMAEGAPMCAAPALRAPARPLPSLPPLPPPPPAPPLPSLPPAAVAIARGVDGGGGGAAGGAPGGKASTTARGSMPPAICSPAVAVGTRVIAPPCAERGAVTAAAGAPARTREGGVGVVAAVRHAHLVRFPDGGAKWFWEGELQLLPERAPDMGAGGSGSGEEGEEGSDDDVAILDIAHGDASSRAAALRAAAGDAG